VLKFHIWQDRQIVEVFNNITGRPLRHRKWCWPTRGRWGWRPTRQRRRRCNRPRSATCWPRRLARRTRWPSAPSRTAAAARVAARRRAPRPPLQTCRRSSACPPGTRAGSKNRQPTHQASVSHSNLPDLVPPTNLFITCFSSCGQN